MKLITNIKSAMMSLLVTLLAVTVALASSHREAPLIADDPLADNVDLYAFRSPDNPNTITLIATYIPLQLPQGGPNYYSFGQNLRYEIHVDNDASVAGDEVTYRFTFEQENEDPSTFFNIRLGAQNLKTTYTLERSMDGGNSFEVIVQNGIVPPNNIGPRSIEGAAGLNTTYDALFSDAITTASTGETVFAGPTDDPFFVDLGGIFDLGDSPRQDGTPIDALACYNVSALAIQVPISTLLKAGAAAEPANILDADYVIGVWASASRPAITTLSSDADPSYSGDWIQVSRIGMPLTNEAVIPIGQKDFWNAITPYEEIAETTLDQYFFNPELALYMDDDLFGGAVPAFGPLRVQTSSLGSFDFSNGADGLFALKGSDAVAGTALDDAVFGTLLLPGPGMPRSVDLWPAFHTGVPNVVPYQLATGKEGNPLAEGKPFVNNFLPNGGDMLRLNMAVPATPRDDANFSSLGLIQAAAIGLTVAPFNTTADLEFIPNMDGFPNGRRLEDDVTRIELQAVAGVVLAAVGLWYDDYDPETSDSPVTQDLLDVLTYTTGVESNDKAFTGSFPYLAQPASGTGDCSGEIVESMVVVDPPEPGAAVASLYISSNTQNQIAVIDIDDMNQITPSTFTNNTSDADGIFFDTNNGLLYQLNRNNGAVYVYDGVSDMGTPSVVGSSAAESKNGREITLSGDRLVIAQDASEANGEQNRLIVLNRSSDGRSFSLSKRYDVDINLWGIQAVGETLYAIEDNSNRLAVFKNFFAPRSGTIEATRSVEVEGIIRTHGLHYTPSMDIMILTDVGSGASPDDGAIIIVKEFAAAMMDGVISSDEQVRVEGPSTLLGNPVDVTLNKENQMIYVAERANGGGRVLSFSLDVAAGDSAPDVNYEFAGASAIHLPNGEDGELGAELMTVSQLFASSNTVQKVGIFNILEDNCIAEMSFNSFTTDADGIYYDSSMDMLYQLNRFNNSVAQFSDVMAAITSGGEPRISALSSASFSNGREIAWSNGRIVVAQDANEANGETNAFVVYNASSSGISLVSKMTTDINLWGIHADGEKLFAVVDNSNMVAEFDDFFSNTGSSVSPDRTVMIEGLVRTHGITYDADTDVMFLTDVGAASSADDGAFIVVSNYASAASDGIVSSSEQVRIEGPNTFLGNPVDIAWDASGGMIYIAERANGGGRILGFMMPSATGSLAPSYNNLFPGASAVYLSGDDGMQVVFARDEVSRMVMDVEVTEIAKTDDVIIDNISQMDVEETRYSVTPNPANDILNIKSIGGLSSDLTNIAIFNNGGQLLMNNQQVNQNHQINISELSPGLYYIRATKGSDVQMIKFIKQ